MKLVITVLFFLRTDCPISNSYAPEIERLSHTPGITFRLVFPDRGLTVQQMEQYRRDYSLTIPGTLDRDRELTKKARAATTPEVAVFADDRLVYHGRIDNRYASLSKWRPAATEHDLEQVLQTLLSGHEPALVHRPAVGCAIGDLP